MTVVKPVDRKGPMRQSETIIDNKYMEHVKNSARKPPREPVIINFKAARRSYDQ